MITQTDPIRLVFPSMLPDDLNKFLSRNDLCMSIRNDKVIIYKGMHSDIHGRKRDPLSDKNLEKRKYNGTLSTVAKKFISKQISLWFNSVEHFSRLRRLSMYQRERSLGLLTVTLSSQQIHSDQEIKRKILVPFIDKLRYNHNIKHYFWRAEKQKNGNIHFHIVVDKYINKTVAREMWNRTQNVLGYIDRFSLVYGHRNPPSTDIRTINNGKYGIKYLLKYATKTDDKQKIGGKIWGMSDDLRCLRQFTVPNAKNETRTILQLINDDMSNVHYQEHYMTIQLSDKIWQLAKKFHVFREYQMRLQLIYEYLYDNDAYICNDQVDTILSTLEFGEIQEITKAYDKPKEKPKPRKKTNIETIFQGICELS